MNNKNKIEFLSGMKHKGECLICHSKTSISLSMNLEDNVNTVSFPLCNKCMVKLLNNVYDKREDLIDDMLREKEGLSLQDIRDSQDKIESLLDEIEDMRYKMPNEEDEDDEE